MRTHRRPVMCAPSLFGPIPVGGPGPRSVAFPVTAGDTGGAVKLISLSASHHNLTLGELERLSLAAVRVGNSLRAQATSRMPAPVPVEGVVVLATCNRFELYVEVAAQPEPDVVLDLRELVTELVASASGVAQHAVRAALITRAGDDVVRHLFQVASGLDSMIVGEREIAGQVRRALTSARESGTTSASLERVFQQASRVSRQVENATGLGASGRSIVSVGLDLVGAGAQRGVDASGSGGAASPGEEASMAGMGEWAARHVLLIGTGSYAGAVVAALTARGAQNISVYSSSGRAQEFAAARGLNPVGTGGLIGALAEADVVVSCAGTLDGALDAAAIRAARAGVADRTLQAKTMPDRAGMPVTRSLTILDLALRRDTAADVVDVEGVRVLDLEAIQRHAPSVGAEPVAQAAELIEVAVEEFARRAAARAVELAALEQIEELRNATETNIGEQVERLRAETDCADQVVQAERAIRREAGARLHRDIMALKGRAGAVA